MSDLKSMNNGLEDLRKSRSQAEFVERRASVENQWFKPSVPLPRCYDTLYSANPDMVVECFN